MAVALFLQACGSSATPSLVQMHSFPKNNSANSLKETKNRGSTLSSGATFFYQNENHLKSPDDSLFFFVLPVNLFCDYSYVFPYVSVTAGVSVEHNLYSNFSIGYWNWIQLHLWTAMPGDAVTVGVTTNPFADWIFGYGISEVFLYLQGGKTTEKFIPWTLYHEVEKEKRHFLEIGYLLKKSILISSKVETGFDLGYLAVSLTVSKRLNLTDWQFNVKK